jgi:hypothetical protein
MRRKKSPHRNPPVLYRLLAVEWFKWRSEEHNGLSPPPTLVRTNTILSRSISKQLKFSPNEITSLLSDASDHKCNINFISLSHFPFTIPFWSQYYLAQPKALNNGCPLPYIMSSFWARGNCSRLRELFSYNTRSCTRVYSFMGRMLKIQIHTFQFV